MPKASKSDSSTREPRAKRSRSKASESDAVDLPGGFSKDCKVVGRVSNFEIRARVRCHQHSPVRSGSTVGTATELQVRVLPEAQLCIQGRVACTDRLLQHIRTHRELWRAPH